MIGARQRPIARMLGVALAAVLAGSCTSGGAAVPTGDSTGRPGSASPSSPNPGPVASPTDRGTIPQPPLDKLNARTRRRLAPESRRVDLAVPSFSNPTEITNPLFPIGELRSAVLVGKLQGRPWRAETTLLPDTKVVDWNGQRIEARQSQFVAYLDGRIFEVAVDLYAQADDGSVWYLGEDAFTYEHGRAADTEGTWRAGVEGPAAMIMPGRPEVGDVYRTENVPGLVFEQVTLKDVNVTVRGPTGPVQGALVGQELHMDEARLEEKTFAPGYGEFFSGGGRTYEATALAVPVDAVPAPPPQWLTSLGARAVEIADAVQAGDWRAASDDTGRLRAAWDVGKGDVPARLAGRMESALAALERATSARIPTGAALRALDVAGAALDIELRYEPTDEIDRGRFELWTRRLRVDAEARDGADVVGDVTTLDWIRDRIPLAASDARSIDDDLRSLEAAAEAGEFPEVARAAERLRRSLAGMQRGP